MRNIYLPIILLLSICCCKTKYENSNEHYDNAHINYPSDVVIIRDSFPISNDLSSLEKEYLVSRNYIGVRYTCNQDTTIEEPILGFPPKVMKEIHSYGKDIVPYLIRNIDMDKFGLAGFVNPYESNLANTVVGSPLGINYAYMIELILAKDSILDKVNYESGYDIWYEKMKPYQIYGQCVIIRETDQNNPKDSKITFDDMKTIKAIYNDWWKSNKDKSLESLRKIWRETGSPLQNSPFMWI